MFNVIAQLRKVRNARKWNQSELGAKLGLPQSHISNIEKGRTDPRLSTVTDIARLLDQELVLVPRQLLPQLNHLLSEEIKHERRWQPDEVDV